ncbi:MAG: type VI secretion system contractile sheath large subunit [Burkholderiales bacterium]|nr:type VI secretion system contractile sheath large subunit [Burkholderiales bacterium]
MPGRLKIDIGAAPPPLRRQSRGPLRLLLIGDFSARPPGQRPPLAQRPTLRVDVDNLDTALRRLAPRAATAAAGTIAFDSIDDFHPDALYRRLDGFAALRRRRDEAGDPQRLAQIAPAAAAGGAPGADLLAGLLGGRPAGSSAAQPAHRGTDSGGAAVEALLRAAVAPHVVPDFSGAQALLLAGVDAAVTALMRSILHDAAFQALESAWRGVQWLIQNLELDEQLELHLFDATREELVADIVSQRGELARTGVHQALADRWRGLPDEQGWSMLAGLDRYGPGDADIGLLAALGLIAAAAGGPFVAGAELALAGAATAGAGWPALRRSEAAPWLGLAAPRLLLRLPYGQAHDPVESFAFEEFDGVPAHEQLLWGTGSLAVALLAGRGFMARGWGMELGDEREIGDLPAYSVIRDGERELQACAEHYLGEQGAQALLEAGLMPLVSHRHRNAVTLPRLQSVAEPAQALRFGAA